MKEGDTGFWRIGQEYKFFLDNKTVLTAFILDVSGNLLKIRDKFGIVRVINQNIIADAKLMRGDTDGENE